MARTDIAIQVIDRNTVPAFLKSSITMTTLDAANDMSFTHDNGLVVFIFNEDAGTPVVTFVGVEEPGNQRSQSLAVTLAAGSVDPQLYVAGPFDAEGFRQADGKVYIDIDAATDARIAVVRLELRV